MTGLQRAKIPTPKRNRHLITLHNLMRRDCFVFLVYYVHVILA